jgi:DNA-directed RNA polymerase subunit M/transcription elongation factor TFIIS
VATNQSRRLFFDLETSPCQAIVWRPGRKVFIPPEAILVENAIICACWKWEGKKKIHSLTWDENHDDRAMLEEFVGVMNAAGEIVAHNGDSFDIPWVRGRCLYHRIPMAPDFMSVDTLKLTRKYFYLNSRRLDYLGKHIGLGGKRPMALEDWKRVINGNEAALKKMVSYCKRDVGMLAEIFRIINPYVPPRSNRAEHVDSCPECGSERTIVNKHRLTAAGYPKTQFQCRDCGKFHTIASSRFAKSRATREEAVVLKELARG